MTVLPVTAEKSIAEVIQAALWVNEGSGESVALPALDRIKG
jgi:hypothetical protein